MKRVNNIVRSKRRSSFEQININGKEAIPTTHAYADIKKPALDSVILKSAAISLKSPMGINSVVLNIKAERERPINGNHFFISTCFLFKIIFQIICTQN